MNELHEQNISAELLPKLYGAMGLALRARKLVVGSNLAEEAVRNGKAKLVLLAQDISENTAKKLGNAVKTKEVPYLVLPATMEQLAKALGKSSLVAGAAITDSGFVAIITKLLDKTHTENSTNGGAATYGNRSKI